MNHESHEIHEREKEVFGVCGIVARESCLRALRYSDAIRSDGSVVVKEDYWGRRWLMFLCPVVFQEKDMSISTIDSIIRSSIFERLVLGFRRSIGRAHE